MSFRQFCRAIGALACIISPATSVSAQQTLAATADQLGLHGGARIVDASWNTPEQQQLIASEFTAATVGTYWNRTRPGGTQYDWSLTDDIVSWASGAGLLIHLHPLWYASEAQTPAWVTAHDPLAPGAADLTAQYLTDNITNTVSRYQAGGVYNTSDGIVCDVVNEAVGPDGQYRAQLVAFGVAAGGADAAGGTSKRGAGVHPQSIRNSPRR